MNDWHYQHYGETKGPVDDNQLRALAEAGVVNMGTPVWRTGYANWIPLSQSDFQFLSSVGPAVTAGAGGAAIAAGQAYGGPAGDYVVDNRGMWQMFTDGLTKNYVTFTGRARRKEWWSFFLFYFLMIVLLMVIGIGIDMAAGNIGGRSSGKQFPIATVVLVGVTYLGTLLPYLAITVRRLHDIGLSGWLILVSFIPYIGGIAILVMMLIPTQFGPNKHGPAPKAPKAV